MENEEGYELYLPGETGDADGLAEDEAALMPALIVGPAPEGVFKAKTKPPRWAFAVVTVAAQSKDENRQLAALVQLVRTLVVTEEKERLHEYLLDNDEAMDQLQEAITKLSNYWSGRPLELSSDSSDSSPRPEPAPPSRVVSLSKATVRVVPAPTPHDGPESSAG